jgi:hypothetical protein
MHEIPGDLRKLSLSNKRVEFFSANGIVVSNQKWSDSHTYSSGLGGYFNASSGYLSLPEIKSYAIQNQEIWLRMEDGKDIQCRYSGQSIPVTTGQKVSVIAMMFAGKSYFNIAIVNHSTNRWHAIGNIDWLVDTQFFRKPSWLATFLTAICGWLLIAAICMVALSGGGHTLKSFINSAPIQSLFAMLIRILPTLPGATDRGESLVFYMGVTALLLLLVPPVYSLRRHVRRYAKFKRTVASLTAHLHLIANSLL